MQKKETVVHPKIFRLALWFSQPLFGYIYCFFFVSPNKVLVGHIQFGYSSSFYIDHFNTVSIDCISFFRSILLIVKVFYCCNKLN